MPDVNTATITVGCKLPCGLLLQLFDLQPHTEMNPVSGETREVKRAVPRGEQIKLNGSARFTGKDMPHDIRSGAGLTYGVDASFFAEWMKRNAEMDLVKNRLVFAQSRSNDAIAQAKDHASLVTGLEPINPDKLPPEFKGKIETADKPA